MKRLLLLLILLPSLASGATFEYYFSNSGGGSACTEESPCSSLFDAKSKIDALASTDIAHLYFDRGDTWTCDTVSLSTGNQSCFEIEIDNPTVHIDAYGAGDKPVFDGLVTDFNDVPFDQSNGTWPVRWSRFFFFEDNNGCSVSNIEIKGTYAYGIAVHESHYFTLSNTEIHDVGGPAVGTVAQSGLHDATAEYNTIYRAQQLYMHDKSASWGSGLQFAIEIAYSDTYNNLIRYNTIYDVFGECVIAPGSTIEYNIVGSCGSAALYAVPLNRDFHDTIIRYNHIVYEDMSTSSYDRHTGGMRACFAAFDEAQGGNNNSGTLSIYGNTCINYERGLVLECVQIEGGGQPQCDEDAKFERVEVYDNLFIDPTEYGVFSKLEDGSITDDFYFSNNSISQEQNVPRQIIDERGYGIPTAGWVITNNHYYQRTTSLAIDSDWDDGMDQTDPLFLSGPPTWSSQTGDTYYKGISPDTGINPPSNSRVFELNPIIDVPIDSLGSGGDSPVDPPVESAKGAALLLF